MSENPPVRTESPEPSPNVSASPAAPSAVVGIGGSAGALGGYERLFLGIPPVNGMAFVVVPHLGPGHSNPEHGGLMPGILERCTSMPVVQIEDGTALQANRVYVIAPGFSLTLEGGVLRQKERTSADTLLIDQFLTSLALDQGERAVAIVLSGLGSDGTEGIRAVKAHGGRVLVEDPGTAEYPEMPRSAADAGVADDVLPIEDLAARLMGFSPQTRLLSEEELQGVGGESGAPLQRILRLVRARTGHDFTRYKRATLVRRIDRRMKGQQIADVSVYLRRLEDSPDEIEALFQDFTINVTSFFRDAEAFEALKTQLRSYLQNHMQGQDTFRVWVAACSTGEEAYSVAIVLRELIEERNEEQGIRVQIFATDIDQAAVGVARQARYPQDISYVVSPERLSRYFTFKDDHYQVRPEVRDLVVFATHSTFGDPPFTRLDLMCCRNMLIYIGAELQQQLLGTFLYALRPMGLLFLGASETVGQGREQFAPLDPRWKIFQRLEGSVGLPPITAALRPGTVNPALFRTALLPPRLALPGLSDLAQQVQRTLLAEHTPSAVVVDEHGEVLYVHGRTARYLELPTGQMPQRVFDMVPDHLRHRLQAAVHQAHAERREIVLRGVRLESGELETGELPTGGLRRLDLSVQPLQATGAEQTGTEQTATGQTGAGTLLIVFRERMEVQAGTGQAGAGQAGTEAAGTGAEQIAALELELSRGRETLRATLEEMTISVEELRTSNEELQTSNEELQSTNEELTTSKEELQSLNEELHSVNAEHLIIIRDQAQASDDTRNLLENMGTAIVFLGNDLHVRRFTSPISHIIPLTAADQGRPLADLNIRLRYTHLLRDLQHVLDTLEPFETQVQTQEGAWYLMRVSPYRTFDNRLEGVVVAFTSIALIKSLEWQLVESLQHAESMIDGFQDPLVLLDQHVRAVSASRALLLALGTGELEPGGLELGGQGGQRSGGGALSGSAPGSSTAGFDLPELQRRLRAVIASEEPLSSSLIELNDSQQQTRRLKTEAEEGAQPEGHSGAGPSGPVGTSTGDAPAPEGQKPAGEEKAAPAAPIPADSND